MVDNNKYATGGIPIGTIPVDIVKFRELHYKLKQKMGNYEFYTLLNNNHCFLLVFSYSLK